MLSCCQMQDGGVLLTTYDLIRSDSSKIRGDSTSRWDYMVIDEGHLIKNSRTKSFKALVGIPCNHRIVVSGTPVQNCAEVCCRNFSFTTLFSFELLCIFWLKDKIQELWTLFKFCNPTLLPGFNTFKRDYSSPLFKGNYKDSTNKEVLVSSKAAEVSVVFLFASACCY